jgi:hypothetical protein
LLWILFRFLTHIAPFNTFVIWGVSSRGSAHRRTEPDTTVRWFVSASLLSSRPLVKASDCDAMPLEEFTNGHN